MKKLLYILSVLVLGLSCSPKIVPVQKDSVRVEIRERLVPYHDIVWFQVPKEKESVVTRDTSSHLENDFAQSDARINPNGSLYHSLNTKPQSVAQPMEILVPVRDTVYMESESTVVIEWKEKELTGWQHFWIKAGIILSVVFAFILMMLTVWFIAKR